MHPLFPRLEAEEEIAYIKGKMQGSAPAKEETKEEEPQEVDRLPEITIDQFMDGYAKLYIHELINRNFR